MVEITKATTDVRTVLLLIFQHFGAWGNSLFFISSAWFLLQKSAGNKKKWFFMFVEIWIVSVVILIISCIILPNGITKGLFVKSLFPTLFANNWYMTCYLLFYLMFPVLNGIIKQMNQTQLFRCAFCLSVLYIFLGCITGWFFPSSLILWVTVYFMIAYMQRYMKRYVDNFCINVKMFLFNLVCFVGLILISEFLGLHYSVLSEKMGHWISNSNPFLIFMSIAMFHIARNIHFKNRFVNYISGLSLLIYIIHENIILRSYVRPAMWNYVYQKYGYSHIIGWVFILVAVIFIISAIVATLYTTFVQKYVLRFSNALYLFLRKKYIAIEKKLLAISGL